MREVLMGIEHITDLQGYDHMLYLLALVAWASLGDALRVLLLATAFTIGHTITLLLAGMGWVHPFGGWIEFLIPVTIFCTALWNLRRNAGQGPSRVNRVTYVMTIVFGLVHGLGFSSFFRMMQDDGDGLVMPLLRFNVGVEIGQAALLLGFLALASLLQVAGVRQREQQVFVCAATGAVALLMALDRSPF
tara:strand:+ start:6808 stop:7377 length:570 start_codon:yes stop_codon:yes gene_type:complete